MNVLINQSLGRLEIKAGTPASTPTWWAHECLEDRRMLNAAPLCRLGVAGDSLSDEYGESSYNYAHNWVESLARDVRRRPAGDVGLAARRRVQIELGPGRGDKHDAAGRWPAYRPAHRSLRD